MLTCALKTFVNVLKIENLYRKYGKKRKLYSNQALSIEKGQNNDTVKIRC